MIFCAYAHMGKDMRKRFIGKKVFIIFACVTLLVFSSVGCGSSADNSEPSAPMDLAPQSVSTKSKGLNNVELFADEGAKASEDVDTAAFEVEEMAEPAGEATEENPEVVTDTSRKLITTMHVGAETDKFDEALPQIEAKVGELGGYIESSEIYNGSSFGRNTNTNRRASFTIRIPADNLGSFIESLGDAYNITSKTTSVEDVTLQYVDLESKKKALLTEEESLLKILESAQTVEDIITVQDRLSQVRYELENMESQLRTFDNQVDYSTVNLSLDEVVKYTPVEEKGAFARMGEGFVESLKSVGNGIKEFVIWFVIHIPQLLLLAIIIAVAYFSSRKIREKKGFTFKKKKPIVEKTEGKDGQ